MNENPEIFDLVKINQVPSHSESCKKYENEKCRFNFGKFFADHTIVSFPPPDDLLGQVKNNILN